MDGNRILNLLLQYLPQGRRRVGRPLTTLRDSDPGKWKSGSKFDDDDVTVVGEGGGGANFDYLYHIKFELLNV